MPMLFCPPVTMSLTVSPFGRMSVSGPGQNIAASRSACGGICRHPAMQVARIVEVHDHRMIGRAAFHLEYLSHRRRIRGVGPESVDRLRREYHQIARTQCLDGFLDFGLCSSYHAPMISNEPLHELEVEPSAEFEGDFLAARRPF